MVKPIPVQNSHDTLSLKMSLSETWALSNLDIMYVFILAPWSLGGRQMEIYEMRKAENKTWKSLFSKATIYTRRREISLPMGIFFL
jgi:hypothetical protein